MASNCSDSSGADGGCLECIGAGMTLASINDEYETNFTNEVFAEVQGAAAEVLGDPTEAV